MTVRPSDLGFGTLAATAEGAADSARLRWRSIFRGEGFGERTFSPCKGLLTRRNSLSRGSGWVRRPGGRGRT